MAGTAKTRGDKKRRAARKRGAFCARGGGPGDVGAYGVCRPTWGRSAGTELEIRSEPNAGAGAESPTALGCRSA